MAFAKTRFTNAEEQKFLEKAKSIIAKLTHDPKKDQFNLKVIEPSVISTLQSFVDNKKITPEEMETIKKNYEKLVSDSSEKPENIEDKLNNFIKTQYDEINKTELAKIKENGVCNNGPCADGLTCAVARIQEDGPKCKKVDSECKVDNDCCSSSCKLNQTTKKKTCGSVALCFKPLLLGQSCMNDPVCSVGKCLEYNSETSGIGECSERGSSCKKNIDCCSNSCSNNKCVTSFVCKDCVKNGYKPANGKKCCEGLYKNEKGMCVPDLPPIVMPQVRLNRIEDFFVTVSDFIISSAKADQVADDAAKKAADATATAQAAATAAANTQAAADAADKALTDAKNTLANDIVKLQAQSDAWDKNNNDPDLQNPYTAQIAADGLTNSCNDTGVSGGWGYGPRPSSLANAVCVANSNVAAAHQANDTAQKAATITNSVVAKLKAKADDIVSSATAIGKSDKLNIVLSRHSNYDTCDINFKDDFFAQLKSDHVIGQNNAIQDNNLFDLEMAFLGFDYVMLGTGVDDYWRTNKSDPKTSIYERLKKIAQDHQAQLQATNDKINQINTKLKCMCLSAKGLANITDQANIDAFKKCPQYDVSGDVSTTVLDDANGDSSGIKAKRLIVVEMAAFEGFYEDLVTNNTNLFNELAAVRDWVSQNASNWGTNQRAESYLWGYTTQSGGWGDNLVNTFVDTWHAVGGVADAVTGYGQGGRSSSPLSQAVSALNPGYTSTWAEATIEGAWQDGFPYIRDDVHDRQCGGWLDPVTCHDHALYLNYPQNNICDKKTYANSCLNNFMTIYPTPGSHDGDPRYVIDPWVPWVKAATGDGVATLDLKSKIIKNINSKNYVEMLDAAQTAGRDHAAAARVGGLGATELAAFSPDLANSGGLELTADTIQLIKDSAKQFAIDQGFFLATDTDNLNTFADYAYEFHFLRPKLSRLGEVSYPTVGLQPHLDLMSNGVAAYMGVAGTSGASAFRDLRQKYLDDYNRTLATFADDVINQKDPTTLNAIKAEMATTNAQLASIAAFKLNLDALNPQSAGGGSSKIGNQNGSLTAGQTAYLNAIKKLKQIRKDQLKSLAFYNKAMAASGNQERAAKVAAAMKSYNSNFMSPLSRSSGSKSGSGLASSSSDGSKAADEGKNKSASLNHYDPNSFNGGAFGGAIGGRSGYGKSSAHSGDKDANAATDAVKPEDEDSKRLAEAIAARDSANQNKYQSSEGLGLFEQVTNAYIRNYDKVLPRKKDKDIVEKK